MFMSTWSVDSSSAKGNGLDNGYLDNARTFLTGELNHDNLDELLGNLNREATRCAVIGIVGHGKQGLLSTGGGFNRTGPTLCIRAHGDGSWEASFKKEFYGRAARIALWGCHVGAGPDGVTLLRQMAGATNALCMAPTGLICCNEVDGFSLEEGATWQVVSPTAADPASIEAPRTDFTGDRDTWKFHMFPDMALMLADLVCIHIFVSSDELVLKDGSARCFALTIDVLNKVHSPCIPGAMVTARMIFVFKTDGGGEVTKKFRVYNDMIVEPEGAHGAWFRTNAAFTARFAAMSMRQ